MANGVCKSLLSFARLETDWKTRFEKANTASLAYFEILFQGLWRTTYRLVRASQNYSAQPKAIDDVVLKGSLAAAVYLCTAPTLRSPSLGICLAQSDHFFAFPNRITDCSSKKWIFIVFYA